MPITVKVLQKHIDRGQPRKCSECPITLAIRGALPPDEGGNARPISVRHYTVRIGDEWYALPLPVSNFIITFDAGGVVPPFTFTLPFPFAGPGAKGA